MDRLVIAVSWAALVGGVLQFAVQLPRVLRLEPRLSLRGHALRSAGTREVVRNAGPAILGRGVVQISAWIDVMLASNLSQGAVSVISYTMTLFLLPISLFGMSMAAAELPELARQRLDAGDAMRTRVNSGLRQIALLAMPSTIGYLVLGDVVISAILQTGRFTASDTTFAWVVLAGFTLGIMASTGTRLFSSTFFALHDTRTPVAISLGSMLLNALLSLVLSPWALTKAEELKHRLSSRDDVTAATPGMSRSQTVSLRSHEWHRMPSACS